ncbi:hypothetical protein PMNALOAF_4109 [Methylobacterium adhaesivum]|uniref:Uncharacterized protein n=1 Tax=Methylobacterium adhaesivum TaxID=333297 RepID=A0ABT8BJX9_9HYPH|nr:hypothetical protein [Methylobacterium adhaesivum]MDN3592488.1 hypothetical protein [Methylobacterium adhaesivum]GJD32830.1 hypothetical protein PMNALOAF_4109 [Methylobacterium adhaesivum]
MPSTSSPAPTLNIKIGSKSTEVTMFFGRLNELAELVGSFERLPEVDFHAPTRTAVLDILLSPRDERGRRTDPEWIIPPDLSIEDAEAALDFAKEHLADFFLGRLEKHLASLQTNGQRLTGVGSSLNGLAPSAS